MTEGCAGIFLVMCRTHTHACLGMSSVFPQFCQIRSSVLEERINVREVWNFGKLGFNPIAALVFFYKPLLCFQLLYQINPWPKQKMGRGITDYIVSNKCLILKEIF